MDPRKQAFKEKLMKEERIDEELFEKGLIKSEGARQWLCDHKEANERYDMWKSQQSRDLDTTLFLDLRNPKHAEWMTKCFPVFMERRAKDIESRIKKEPETPVQERKPVECPPAPRKPAVLTRQGRMPRVDGGIRKRLPFEHNFYTNRLSDKEQNELIDQVLDMLMRSSISTPHPK